MNTVWQRGWPTATKRLVLLALADIADDCGNSMFPRRPSVDLIAQKACCSPRQAKRLLHELAAEGEIEIGKALGGASIYRILCVTPPERTSRRGGGGQSVTPQPQMSRGGDKQGQEDTPDVTPYSTCRDMSYRSSILQESLHESDVHQGDLGVLLMAGEAPMEVEFFEGDEGEMRFRKAGAGADWPSVPVANAAHQLRVTRRSVG